MCDASMPVVWLKARPGPHATSLHPPQRSQSVDVPCQDQDVSLGNRAIGNWRRRRALLSGVPQPEQGHPVALLPAPSGGMQPSSAGRRTAAPTASIATVQTNTWAKRDLSLPSGRAWKLLSTMSCVDRDARWPKTRNRAVESVVIPSPPSWINARITTCPKVENSLPVSRTVRPVTHTALVAVNSASSRPIRALADAGGWGGSMAPPSRPGPLPPSSARVGCLRSRCRQKPTVPRLRDSVLHVGVHTRFVQKLLLTYYGRQRFGSGIQPTFRTTHVSLSH